MCPAGHKLDEECFQQTPLPFADGTSVLRWGGVGGRTHRFNATDVSAEALRRAYDNATSPEGLDQLTRAQGRIVALTGEALERAAMAATSQ